MSATDTRFLWQRWRENLSIKFTLPQPLPPLRMLLTCDNLAGHKTPEFVLWLCAHGILPLYTPLGGSWLNMAESIQRILKRRALSEQHPQTPQQIMDWFEAVAQAWNQHPTPFEWGGNRAARRQRARIRDGSISWVVQVLGRLPQFQEIVPLNMAMLMPNDPLDSYSPILYLIDFPSLATDRCIYLFREG